MERGVEFCSFLISEVDRGQRSVFCFMLQALLPPWKALQYPQNSSQFGHFGERKNFLQILENKPRYICRKHVVYVLVIISIILNRLQRVV